MKYLILILTLLFGALACSFALTITQAEYFVNSDPGPGNGSPIFITPGETESVSGLMVPTTGLIANRSHRVFLRYRSEEGPWSMTEARYFFLFQSSSNYSGRTVTQAEYWFDNLPGTVVDIADDNSVTYAALLPTSGLASGISHKFSVRYYDNTGKVSGAEARYFFLFQSSSNYSGRAVTQAEYWFDNLPGTVVDIADDQLVTYAALLPTSSLALNVSHKFSVRYYDNTGRIGGAEARYFFLHLDQGTVTVDDITAVEYHVDNGTPTVVDLADTTFANYTDLIATAGLSLNVSHKFTVRYLDERSVWSGPEAKFFFLHQDSGGVTVHDITHLEYWYDELPHLLLDIADAVNVSFTDSIPHSLAAGPHFLRLRYRDDRGLLSETESRPFFVWTGAGPQGNARLAGMELFVNQDPGVGNGLQISFPQDGQWDELTETVDTVLTGIPTGVHRMGVRFRDELGKWSITLIDTFVVGPVLVIRTSGNDVVLNWIAEPTDIPFHVYRAAVPSGPFTDIAQTNNLFYTDAGAVSGALKRFYYITWTNNGPSAFRLPREPDLPAR